MAYSNHLAPNLDFKTLMFMRMAQTFSLAFLFVPISTISYLTIPKKYNGDAAALYTMFRNIAGSIGISVATALITSRTQIHLAHLSQYMSPLWQPFNNALAQIRGGLIAHGTAPDRATGVLYTMYLKQAAVLAYTDVFALCAIMAFCVVPLAFLFSSKKAVAPAGGGGH